MQAEQQQNESGYITTKAAATYLMIHPETLRSFIRARKIPCYRINKAIRFNKKEIDSWIQEFRIDVHPIFKKRAESLARRRAES